MSLKAFDLLPVIENVTIGIGQEHSLHPTIHTIECSGENIYVGTTDSYVIHYILEENRLPDLNCVLLSSHQGQTKQIKKTPKPVVQLRAVSALNLLLCLWDGQLLVLSMSSLKTQPSLSRLKGVYNFCLNENPSGLEVELCVAKGKQVQLCNLMTERIVLLKEFNIPEPPVTMSMDGYFVCLALSNQYSVLDCTNGQLRSIFPFNRSHFEPQIQRITKEEFLLNGPEGLGIFATTEGSSQRPPIFWGDRVISLAYSHPYVLTLTVDFLAIYSILDQSMKQRIPFYGGFQLDNFDGHLLVSSPDTVCSLYPVPWQNQVDNLLNEQRVDEALELIRYVNRSGMPEEKFQEVHRSILQKAGFVKFSLFQMEEAKQLFLQGQLDPRELLLLFPGFLSSNNRFVGCSPPLHSLKSVDELCQGDGTKLEACKSCLRSFLETGDHGEVPVTDLNLWLLKIYADTNDSKLSDWVSHCCQECPEKEVEEILVGRSKYYALGLYVRSKGHEEKALNVWNKIILGELNDVSFPGITFLVNVLKSLQVPNLVWKYAETVLNLDQEEGVKIFTERKDNYEISTPADQSVLKPDSIVNYLHRYPSALLKLLEDLIFQRKIQKEKFHTHLVTLYLDRVIRLRNENGVEQEEARRDLQNLLRFSSCYRVQLVLGKASENGLDFECSILYGKLEEHERALKILVHTLSDYRAAEDYCRASAEGRDLKYRQKLFQTLLGVYLDPNLESLERENLLVPAIDLLNSRVVDFDAVKVLQMLPSDWSMAVVDKFLSRSLLDTGHRQRCVQLQRALTRQGNINARFLKFHYTNSSLQMTEDRICGVCQKPILECNFAWYPNGVVTHCFCAKHLTCTLSGKTFTGPRTTEEEGTSSKR